MAEAENPYGDGHAAERIVAALEHLAARHRAADPVRPRLQPRDGRDRRRLRAEPRARARAAEGGARRLDVADAEIVRRRADPRRARSRAACSTASDGAAGAGHADLALRGPARRLGGPLHRLPGRRRRRCSSGRCCSSSAPTARSSARRSRRPSGADAFTWVFLVPAMNEEVTIADSVERLVELPVARRRIDRDRRRLRRPHRRDPRRDRPPRPLRPAPRRAGRPQGQGGGAEPRLPEPLRDARRPRAARSSSSSTPTAACTPQAPHWASSSLRRPAGRRRPVAGPDLQPPAPADLAAGRRVRRSTATSSRPAATTGAPPGWAATASSTGSARSTRSPTRRAPGATS